MYQNLANQNPILNQFNGYIVQNPDFIPFQNNKLINQNVHVMNNLSEYLQQQRVLQQNIPVIQQSFLSQNNSIPNSNPINKTNKSKNINIIQEILKPQKIVKNQNKDVETNYNTRNQIQEEAKIGNIGIKMTNAPYKNIIKDKIITKDIHDVKKEDLLVHKTDKKIDANLDNFMHDLELKNNEKKKINDELLVEFSIDNYDRHKTKFAYKETFIRNLAFEENTFNENKQDFIEFYRKKQREAEEGQKLCDQILHNMVDEGIISKDELPIEQTFDNKDDIDLNNIMSTIKTSDNSNTDKKNQKPVITRPEKVTLKSVMGRKSKQ